ncbi:MAG TPA: preprotein translocase subunit SecE [Clostridiales bacterium]|jgi:preprotein translocase subunit SecE|nr:preprotein translocase subunit SecE [Clostridiales bacterium]
MSEKKAVRSADKKENFLTRAVAWLKRLPSRIAQPFKNMWRELKKVTWPSRNDLINYTLIVLAFMVFMGVVIGLLDAGASSLIALLMG